MKKQHLNVWVSALAVLILISAGIVLNYVFGKPKDDKVLETNKPVTQTKNPTPKGTQQPIPTKKPLPRDKYSSTTLYADVTHDGLNDAIVIMPEREIIEVYDFYENLVWKGMYGTGSRAFYLYEQDEKNYIMTWDPEIFEYQVFSVILDGEIKHLEQNRVDFEYPPKNYNENKFDELFNFYDSALEYISNSTLLYGYNDLGKRIYSENGNAIKDTELIEKLSNIDKNKKYVFNADVTHDGLDEKIVVDLRFLNETDAYYVNVYSGEERHEKLIWSQSAGMSHSEWKGTYLYKDEETNLYYLVRWNPSMYTGSAVHGFEVYSLKSNGKEEVLETIAVSFDSPYRNNGASGISEILNFCEVTNSYLEDSILLLDTDEGKLVYSTPEYRVANTKYSKEWYLSAIGIDTKLEKKNIKTPAIVGQLKKSLKIGMSPDKVEEAIGIQYEQDYPGQTFRVYYLDTVKPLYLNYDATDDIIDFNMIIKGSAGGILHVSYDKDYNLSQFTIYYTNGYKINSYSVLGDGTVVLDEYDFSK